MQSFWKKILPQVCIVDKHTFCIFHENMHSPKGKHVSFFVIWFRVLYYYVCISKLQFLLYSNIPVMGLLYQGLHFISPTYFSNTQFAGFYIYS